MVPCQEPVVTQSHKITGHFWFYRYLKLGGYPDGLIIDLNTCGKPRFNLVFLGGRSGLGAMSGYSSDTYGIRALITCLLYDSVFHLNHEVIEIINFVPMEYFHATFNEIISQFQ